MMVAGVKFDIILNQQTPIAGEAVILKDSKSLIEDFCRFANTVPNCAGLAANQVAYNGERINLRFFTVFINNIMHPIINPEIIETHGSKSILHEGCKTWPNKIIIGERYNRIKVKYSIFDGSIEEEELMGSFAQVFQHELNHLDGVKEEFYQYYNVGRNDSCLCRSGKKYKKCCGR